MSDDITCPYCDYGFEIDHDGPTYYQEDHGVETECPNCEKIFLVYGSMSWYWEGRKADCLNGSPHEWNPWRKLWEDEEEHPGKIYARRSCRSCEEEQMEWRDSLDD